MDTIVFFHAHPDDEAIFTGGTLARLSQGGLRVVVVVATSGELGVPAEVAVPLARHREDETRAACELLGVHRVEFLGYDDSGLGPVPPAAARRAFSQVPVEEAAERLAAILDEERPSSLVVYDDGGIYAHPDHVAVHHVGLAAARRGGVHTVYEATVDREYLHFVETHLVGHAVASLHEAGPVGVPTVMVSSTVDVHGVLDRKRAAISAHASQIPSTAEPLTMDTATFSAVYGYEWYVRRGPRHVIDELAM